MMKGNNMSAYTIKFLPDNKEVQVESGATILHAAEEAGVLINSLCGGNGACGKCKVQVPDGKAHADMESINYLSKDEVKEGFVLACQAKVYTDMEVVIPPEARLEDEQILMDEPVMEYSQPEKLLVHRVPRDPLTFYEPLSQKVYLELEEPTQTDNVSDIDRVIRALRKKTDYQQFRTTFKCLRGLAETVRESSWKVTATIARDCDLWRILQVEPGDTSDRNYGLAIDIGTTTVVAQLVHMKSGNVVGVAGSHNLQAHYGADVISRMIYACSIDNGLNTLHVSIIENINELINTLTEQKGINRDDITAAVATGNTTMSHLLLSLIPCSIRLDPYVPTAKLFPQINPSEISININPSGVMETFPAVASYVGGDIVAGVIACGIADRPEIRVLIDVGTNGEIAIGNNEWLVCTSASAGPAFEGGGISHGMRATRGAIQRLSIKDGSLLYETIGRAKPRGICGSGLIDCLSALITNQIIDSDGKFRSASRNERIVERDGELQFIVAYGPETETGKELTISESDIINIIRSKAAVFAAIKSLINYVGFKFDDIHKFYVAGGFGTYLDIPNAISIGLLPDIDIKKIQFVGNSSLMGARIGLLSVHAIDRAARIAAGMTNIELSTYQPFMDEYVGAMFLPHTDRNLFPSIRC
jgi:uncharacterized 2Fe-2S/4Fe-4S cluster protein (DUF4445 family)